MQIDKLNPPNKFPIYLFTLAVLGSQIIWLETMQFSESLILGGGLRKPRICSLANGWKEQKQSEKFR